MPVALALGALGASGCTVTTDSPNLAGQDVQLTVMHTSDTHSRYFPYFFAPGSIDQGLGLVPRPGRQSAVVGGISRVGTVLKCARGIEDGPQCDSIRSMIGPPAVRSIHLDSGDIFQGAPVFNVYAGEVEMRSMAHLGLTAMALGNHEMDKGAPNLFLQWQQWGNFPVLAANYMFEDPREYSNPKSGLAFPQVTVTNMGGVKVGIIGMANLASIQGIIEGGNSLGIRPLEAKEALTSAAAILRPQVDLIFVVSHLGLEEDEDSIDPTALADTDPSGSIGGIDVVFGGHLHIVLNPPQDIPHYDAEGNYLSHTIVVHSGAFAKYVGRLDLVAHIPTDEERASGTAPFIKAHTYRVIPIDDHIPEDEKLIKMLEPYQFKMNQFLNLSQAYALVPCPKGSTDCPKVLRNDTTGGDSQLGNLVATSMRLRRRVEADFALTNSLGIRTDFEAGPLTLEQMYNVFPFENTIATMFLSGQEVQQMLDFVAARSGERGCRSQVQVSGIYFDMICSTNNPECEARLGRPSACATNIYLGDNCRKSDNTIDTEKCRALEPFGEYRVAVNDYIANGGSGFSVLKRNTTKYNTGISLRDALIDFIRNGTERCDPADYGNVVGVTCRHPASSGEERGVQYDCSATCCCHDDESGPVRCSAKCDAFKACADQQLQPAVYDYSNTACILPTLEQHDGRILPLTEVQ